MATVQQFDFMHSTVEVAPRRSGAGDRGKSMNQKIAAALALSLTLAACSSRPREFNPSLAAATADTVAFDAAYANCRELYVDGKLDGNGRLASTGAGAAAAGAIGVAGSAAATSAGLYGGMAVASATIIALPFVALGGAYGMAKAKQKKKERAIQRAMSGCLSERGYQVASWVRAPKRKE